MVLQPLSPEVYQLGEKHQLGAPVGIYTRRVTLSGKVAFTGILLLALAIVGAFLILLYGSSLALSPSSLAFSLMGFCQGIFLVGMLLSMMRHEELISPLHPKLSVSVYTEGLLYRKGRKIQVVRWEQIQSIRRQFTAYRRKGKIILTRPAYTCELSQKPGLVLSAAISNVDEVGAFIERELTKRLLPQVQVDYQAGKPIVFSNLSLTRQSISNRERNFAWERVSRVEVGPEKLVIEGDGNHSDLLIVPLTDISNLCVLEALLEHIRQEKGFDLFLETGTGVQNADAIVASGGKRSTRLPKKTSWVSSLVLMVLILLVVGAETSSVIDSLNGERPASQHYPAFLLSNPPLPPQAGLPYTSRTVYDAFLAAGIKMNDVEYTDGWACCATYQPEGRMVSWEESYGVVLEIATFATPIEAKTDANDLLTNSAGYSVYTRNLCLFFYDNSLSKAHITDYIAVMSEVCK